MNAASEPSPHASQERKRDGTDVFRLAREHPAEVQQPRHALPQPDDQRRVPAPSAVSPRAPHSMREKRSRTKRRHSHAQRTPDGRLRLLRGRLRTLLLTWRLRLRLQGRARRRLRRHRPLPLHKLYLVSLRRLSWRRLLLLLSRRPRLLWRGVRPRALQRVRAARYHARARARAHAHISVDVHRQRQRRPARRALLPGLLLLLLGRLAREALLALRTRAGERVGRLRRRARRLVVR